MLSPAEPAFGLSRFALDQLLLTEAVSRGAELRQEQAADGGQDEDDGLAADGDTEDRTEGRDRGIRVGLDFLSAKGPAHPQRLHGDHALGYPEHARDPALLLALGKLCMRQGLWGKAQSYIEASLALEPTHDGHMTLASLMEKIGKPQEAEKHFRR